MNKVKKLAKNEIRAFKIKGNAISELLRELLNKYGSGFLDIPDDDFDNIFHLKWDRTRDQLIFYSVEFE